MKLKRGKSKKETWRKLTACDDVDDFLVQQRDDEIRGTDDSFFFFDTKSDYVSVTQDVPENKNIVGPVDVTKLRCFAGIYRNPSAVKDPVIKRNPIKTREKRIKANSSPPVNKPPHPPQQSATYDLWGADSASPSATRTRSKKAYIPSAVPAVELPAAGLSVNPSFLDHQALLRSALDKHNLAESKKKKPHPKKIFAPETKPEAEIKDDPEEKEEEDDKETIVTRPLAKPKTRAARRRQQEEKVKEEVRKKEKQRRLRENEVFKVKSIKKKLDAAEKKQKVKLAERVRKVSERAKFGVKELSRFKFNEASDPITLSDELTQRLRDIGPSGGKAIHATQNLILTDRFKSLQKRNVIEVRIKNKQKRKHKGKKYTRASDKMDWEKTGEWNGVKVGPDAIPKKRQQKKKD